MHPVIKIFKESASQVLRLVPPQVGNQSQWSQDHRICMNYKCYYNTYVPSYLLQMVQTASVSMTMRFVCVIRLCRKVMETVVQNTKENSGAIFTNSVPVVTLCPVDENLGLTGHGKPVPKSPHVGH